MELWTQMAAVLVVDMFQNSLMLLMALRVQRARIRPLRVFFAAFLGALLSAAAKFAQLSRGACALLWLPAAFMMMAAAGGGAVLRGRPLRAGLVLMACAGFLGGVVLSLYGATGSLWMAHLLSGACAAAIFVSILRAGHAAKSPRCIRVRCAFQGNICEFDAIADSGNTLRDYLTHKPVIVVGEAVGKRLVREEAGFRLIFADTAGGRQMMRLFIPQETTLTAEGKARCVDAAVAVSPGLGRSAPALVPTALLDDDL